MTTGIKKSIYIYSSLPLREPQKKFKTASLFLMKTYHKKSINSYD